MRLSGLQKLLLSFTQMSLGIQSLVNPRGLVFDILVSMATQQEHLGLDLSDAVHSIQGGIHGLGAGGLVVWGEGGGGQVGLLHRVEDVGEERCPAEDKVLLSTGPQ